MNNAKQKSLREMLASVPENARLVIEDEDGMGASIIPVGRWCHAAAAALPESNLSNHMSTHSTECYKWHHECAIAEIERMRAKEPVAWMHTNGVGHVYFRKKPQDKVFNPRPVYVKDE